LETFAALDAPLTLTFTNRGVSLMDLGKLLQQWIETLAGVYLACLDVWTARRVVIITCDGDRFTVRKLTPKAGTDSLSIQADESGEAVLSKLSPGKKAPGKVMRAAKDSLIVLELPPAEVAARRISVPAQAREFLAGIVRNQIERLSPWQSDQTAYGFDADVNSEDPSNLDVSVLIASRATVDGFRDQLGAMGLTIDRVVTRQSQTGSSKFITLWSRLATLAREDLERVRWRIGAGIAATILLSLVLSLWALISAASLRAETDDMAVRTKALLRQIEGRGGQSLAALKPGERVWYEKEASPTAAIVVEAVSRALPDTAYLTELRLEGVALRMVGLTNDAASLIAPLEQSGHLADVHFFAPTTRESDGALFRFHIEARVKPHFKIAEGP
jgi:general secretion pathway protein L